jgi:hypothetical protein
MNNIIWKLGCFERSGSKEAKCIACAPPRILKLSNYNTNGLMTHLAHHQELKVKYEKMEKDAAEKVKLLKISKYVQPVGNGIK